MKTGTLYHSRENTANGQVYVALLVQKASTSRGRKKDTWEPLYRPPHGNPMAGIGKSLPVYHRLTKGVAAMLISTKAALVHNSGFIEDPVIIFWDIGEQIHFAVDSGCGFGGTETPEKIINKIFGDSISG